MIEHINHHPAFADQSVLDPPEIQRAAGDAFARGREAKETCAGMHSCARGPTGEGDEIAVTKKDAFSKVAGVLGQAVAELLEDAVGDALVTARGAKAGGAVPKGVVVPVPAKTAFGCGRCALFQVVQHVPDALHGGLGGRLVIGRGFYTCAINGGPGHIHSSPSCGAIGQTPA